jgi:putative transposase
MSYSSHSRSLRSGRHSVDFQPYLVTSVTEDRRPWFSEFWTACVCARALTNPRLWPDANLLAWVLMPDHFHLLVVLGPDASLARRMKSVKSVTSLEVGRVVGTKGIWQHGYHEHALRTSESVRDAARYLVANPVRAGLVDSVADYSFWDAVWVGGGGNPLEP